MLIENIELGDSMAPTVTVMINNAGYSEVGSCKIPVSTITSLDSRTEKRWYDLYRYDTECGKILLELSFEARGNDKKEEDDDGEGENKGNKNEDNSKNINISDNDNNEITSSARNRIESIDPPQKIKVEVKLPSINTNNNYNDNENKELKNENSQLKRELNDVKSKTSDYINQISSLKNDIIELKKKYNNLISSTSKSNGNDEMIKSLSKTINENENIIRKKDEKIDSLAKENHALRNENEELKIQAENNNRNKREEIDDDDDDGYRGGGKSSGRKNGRDLEIDIEKDEVKEDNEDEEAMWATPVPKKQPAPVATTKKQRPKSSVPPIKSSTTTAAATTNTTEWTEEDLVEIRKTLPPGWIVCLCESKNGRRPAFGNAEINQTSWYHPVTKQKPKKVANNFKRTK